LIDTVKATVPIWKRETWVGGSDWTDGTCEADGQSAPEADHHLDPASAT
jgi:molybdopterin synthase catalytic subunit